MTNPSQPSFLRAVLPCLLGSTLLVCVVVLTFVGWGGFAFSTFAQVFGYAVNFLISASPVLLLGSGTLGLTLICLSYRGLVVTDPSWVAAKQKKVDASDQEQEAFAIEQRVREEVWNALPSWQRTLNAWTTRYGVVVVFVLCLAMLLYTCHQIRKETREDLAYVYTTVMSSSDAWKAAAALEGQYGWVRTEQAMERQAMSPAVCKIIARLHPATASMELRINGQLASPEACHRWSDNHLLLTPKTTPAG